MESMFLLAKKKIALRCSLQLKPDMRPYTPSTDQAPDEFWNYVVEPKILEDR